MKRSASRRQFRINGDVVYIDNWVVKFDDKYVERAEIDRSTSLVLFRRIFGENQTPNEGFAIDAVGSRPQAYGTDNQMSEFEKQIWEEFWTIANDEAKAQGTGHPRRARRSAVDETAEGEVVQSPAASFGRAVDHARFQSAADPRQAGRLKRPIGRVVGRPHHSPNTRHGGSPAATGSAHRHSGTAGLFFAQAAATSWPAGP